MIGYWVIGLPAAYVYIFVYNGGILGLWLGPLIAMGLNSIFYYFYSLRIDWQDSVRDS